MIVGNIFAAGQVGDGAGQAQDAVVGAGRPLKSLHGIAQQRFAAAVRLAQAVDLARAEVAVALALAQQLSVGGTLHAGGNGAGGFAFGIGAEQLRRHRIDVDLDVDAVQQRAGQAILIGHQLSCADALIP